MTAPFTLTSPTAGGELPDEIGIVGGIVLDLVGLNGVRVVSQLAASALFVGFFDGENNTIGTQSGFTKGVVDALGGGLSEVAVRMTIFDGDSAPENFDDRDNILHVNGVSFGDFTEVMTLRTDQDGVPIGSPTAGFPNNTLNTGFFHLTDEDALKEFFDSLSAGAVTFELIDEDPGDNFFDFTQGIDSGLADEDQPPNVSPVINKIKVKGAKEGSTTTIEVDASDPDNTPGGLTYGFDLDNDGTVDETNTTGMLELLFDDDEALTIGVVVTDGAGVETKQTVDVDIENVKPTLTLSGKVPITADGVATLSGVIKDPGTADTFTLEIDWGEAGADDRFETITFQASKTGEQTFEITRAYDLDKAKIFDVSVTLRDDDGGKMTKGRTVDATNAAPTVTLENVLAIDENGEVILRGTVDDADPGETLTLLIDWGDKGGARFETVTVIDDGDGDPSFRLTHIYRDDRGGENNDRYTIKATVTDSAGATGTAKTTAKVNNVAPAFDSPTEAAPPSGQKFSGRNVMLEGDFVDAGRRDGHTLTIDWGDGRSSSSDENPAQFPTFESSLGKGRFEASHRYDSGGIFNIVAKLKDDDGGKDVSRETVFVRGIGLSDDGELQIVSDEGATNVVIFSNEGNGPTFFDGGSEPQLAFSPTNGRKAGAAQTPNMIGVDSDISGAGDPQFSSGSVKSLRFVGSDARDTISVSSAVDVPAWLKGNEGNDDLRGGDLNDSLDGNRGADLLLGGDGRDTVKGGFGNDLLFGDFDNAGGGSGDLVLGREGNDTLLGGGGRDTVDGGQGKDRVSGGHGQDTVLGGSGSDILFGDGDEAHPRVDVRTALEALADNDGRVEKPANAANDRGDLMRGGMGSDLIFGQGGDDTIFGDDGNDTIVGGKGDDVIALGRGNDVLVFHKGDGDDRVSDFDRVGRDVIDLRDLGRNSIDTAEDVLDRARKAGNDVVIDLGQGDSIRLEDFSLSDLDRGDFLV
ncbi:MAG: hypothetical protein AAGJ94_16390 [Pseudomonadota bacterium]